MDLFTNSHGVEQWALDPDAAQNLRTTSLNFIASGMSVVSLMVMVR